MVLFSICFAWLVCCIILLWQKGWPDFRCWNATAGSVGIPTARQTWFMTRFPSRSVPKSRDDRMRSVREPTNSGTFGVIWDMMSYVFCKNVGRACGVSLYSESMSENHPMNWFLYHITLNDTVYTTVTIWIHNSMLFASWSTYCPMKRIRVSMHLPSIVAVSVCKFGFASCAGTLDFSIVRGTYGRNLWLWRENTRQGVRSTGASTTFWEGKWKVTRPQHLHTQTCRFLQTLV